MTWQAIRYETAEQNEERKKDFISISFELAAIRVEFRDVAYLYTIRFEF